MNGDIFRHPVGTFPMGARWYLACTAILSLLCLAMHLAIQNQAQRSAERLIQEWGKKAGIEIAGVHYHLLRNALILRELNITRGKEHIAVSHMLLRANPRLLTGPDPQIGGIEVAGLEALLSFDGINQTWRQDERLQRLWRAARYLKLDNGIVTLFPRNELHQPLTFAGLSLRQRIQNQQRAITATAQLATGDIHWQWQSNDQEGEASGKMGWRRINASLIAASLGLRPIDGELHGHASWRTGNRESPDIEGRMEFTAGQGRPTSLLQWQATETTDGWRLDAAATAWPIDAWADSLPRIGNHPLISGELTGPLLWQGSPEGWRLNSSRGELRNIIFAAADEHGAPPWRWQKLTYEELYLAPAEHRLTASGMRLTEAEMGLMPQLQPAEPSAKAPEQAWTLAIDSIQVEQLTLTLHLNQGSVEIPVLQGSSSLTADGEFTFDLSSGATDAAESAGPSGKKPPLWQLNGHALRRQGASTEARFDLLARHIPAHRLRPLIPLEATSGKPLALEGDVTELDLVIQVSEGLWQTTGEMTAADIRLVHAGDILEMDQLAIQFGPVGMGLSGQRISQIDVRGWRYLTVLNPLPPHLAKKPGDQGQPPPPTWWTTVLRRQNWSVDAAIWLDGTVSVGHVDSYWAEGVDLRITRLQRGRWAQLRIRGRVGDGAFALSGAWDALSLPSRFKGEASLSNALPFFLRNWMNISGMPLPLRGRLSASLTVAETEKSAGYHALAKIGLRRGLTRLGVFPNDPLLSRVGHNTNDILMLLSNARGNAELSFETSGNWRRSPLTPERLGRALQSAIQQQIRAREQQEHMTMRDPGGESLLRMPIRLRGDDSLSLNERARLHKALRLLRDGPDRVIDLVPRWAGSKLDAELQARIKKTQHLIEQYLTYRGVAKERIFPLWPTMENQVKEIGSISLVVRQLRQPSPE